MAEEIHIGKQVSKKKKIHSKDRKLKANEEENERRNTISCVDSIDFSSISSFSDFPLSGKTQKGLTDSGFTKPTEIQKQGIALALQKRDILGAAKTGSGKTLAFIIPLIELLWHEKWSDADGMGALVISPTRELALQIYDVLRKVGKQHDFSAGLVIGGKDLKEEQQRILNTNIVIGTPGRILQHFDETPSFSCLNLKFLVFDEADRILDLGFSTTINAIIENLPEERQTLLYSATQTKSVKDLARLSLHNPEYIAVHEMSKYSTPKKLLQNYVILELHGKIDFLYSFVKNHLRTKCIVFLSSCKQVKFLYEVFRKLRPGIPLMALYGKQKQLKRVMVYNRFCSIKNAILFATDIAARGLDFPAVNWVVQYDCPEDPDTYIHRVGRTARYEKGGHALLMLNPSEENMINKLIDKRVPIHKLQCNPKKIKSIQGKVQAFCVQDLQIKEWAQKSIVSYVRSIYLQGDKTIFDVTKLPLDQFSFSYGLMKTPKLNFLKNVHKKNGPAEAKLISLNFNGLVESDDEVDESDILVSKVDNFHHEIALESPQIMAEAIKGVRKHTTKSKLAKKLINKNINISSKIIFDDNGDIIYKDGYHSENEKVEVDDSGIDIEKSKLYIKQQDKVDYINEKERVKQKHKDKKERERLKRKQQNSSELDLPPTLGDYDDMLNQEEEVDTISYLHKRVKLYQNIDDTNNEKLISTLEEDEGLALHLLE